MASEVNSSQGEERSVYTLKELNEMKVEGIPYLWDGIFPEAEIGFITGPSDSNKTTFLRQLGYAIIQSHEGFLGRKLSPRKRRVIYISTEDSIKATAAATLSQGTASMPAEIQNRMVFVFKPPRSLEELEPLIGSEGVDAIVSDTWTDTFSGDITNPIQVRQNLNVYRRFAQKHQCMILLVHHSRKGSEGSDPNKGQMLGSQALESAPRIVVDIRKEGDKRQITVVKGNYTPDELKKRPIYARYNSEIRLLELCDPPSVYGFEKELDKEELMPHILKLKEVPLTVDKIREALGKLFPDKKIPAHGTVVNWLKESKNDGSQSAQP